MVLKQFSDMDSTHSVISFNWTIWYWNECSMLWPLIAPILLIGLYGIETWESTNPASFNCLLIGLYGIETAAVLLLVLFCKTFNWTIWYWNLFARHNLHLPQPAFNWTIWYWNRLRLRTKTTLSPFNWTIWYWNM